MHSVSGAARAINAHGNKFSGSYLRPADFYLCEMKEQLIKSVDSQKLLALRELRGRPLPSKPLALKLCEKLAEAVNSFLFGGCERATAAARYSGKIALKAVKEECFVLSALGKWVRSN